MTIGLLIDDTLDKPDGVQAAVLAIGSELAKRGHDVHYIVAETQRTDIANVHSMVGFRSFKFNGNTVRTPKRVSSRRIKELFSTVTFDCLHVQMPFSPYMSGKILAAAPSSVRLFGTFHILPYSLQSAVGTKILGRVATSRPLLRRFTSFFAVSEPALTFMHSSYGVDGTVLPNPVDYSFYHSYRVKKTTSKHKKIVFVGRFEERKGVVELLRAYAAMPEAVRSSTELILCGKGPLHQKVAELADTLKIRVTLPGFVSAEEKARYLATADVAVFPSKAGESFGIVLTEAMAAGARITLGGDNPGYASVLGRWPETLFSPKDTQAFSEKLVWALTDSTVAVIGEQQHTYVKQFATERVVDTLEKAYTAAR